MNKYYLILRDEDSGKTHICLHEKDDRHKTLELVEAQALLDLQEKVVKLEEDYAEVRRLFKKVVDEAVIESEKYAKLVELLKWTRDGIQHFNDHAQVEHLSSEIDTQLAALEQEKV